MGEAFLYGNGEQNPLNFRVIGSLVQPAAPKENTIWVNTDTTITSWVFAPEAPTNPEGGMIFFKTDKTSPVGFNALRKNEITVLPTFAQQYIGGQWKNVYAYAYIGGTWVQFSSEKYVVFEAGKGLSAGLTGFSNATYNSDKIVAKSILGAGSGKGDAVISKEKIDVTQYKTATFSGINCNFSGNGNANSSHIYAFVGGASTTIGSAITSGSATLASNKTVTVDISNVTGPVEFGFRTYSNAAYGVSFKNFNLNGIVFS
mgnify:FL=1